MSKNKENRFETLVLLLKNRTAYQVSLVTLCGIVQDSHGRFRLLQLVVDANESSEHFSGWALVEFVFFVMQRLGICPALHGPLPQELLVQWKGPLQGSREPF